MGENTVGTHSVGICVYLITPLNYSLNAPPRLLPKKKIIDKKVQKDTYGYRQYIHFNISILTS